MSGILNSFISGQRYDEFTYDQFAEKWNEYSEYAPIPFPQIQLYTFGIVGPATFNVNYSSSNLEGMNDRERFDYLTMLFSNGFEPFYQAYAGDQCSQGALTYLSNYFLYFTGASSDPQQFNIQLAYDELGEGAINMDIGEAVDRLFGGIGLGSVVRALSNRIRPEGYGVSATWASRNEIRDLLTNNIPLMALLNPQHLTTIVGYIPSAFFNQDGWIVLDSQIQAQYFPNANAPIAVLPDTSIDSDYFIQLIRLSSSVPIIHPVWTPYASIL